MGPFKSLAKEGHAGLTVEERRKILFEKLELSGLESWTEENKEKALNLLAEYHDIFALEDGEMGCTKAAEHKIEVMDPKPFKMRPRNIPSKSSWGGERSPRSHAWCGCNQA